MSQLMLRNSSHENSGSYKCEATAEYIEIPVSDIEGISVSDGPNSSCYDSPTYTHCDKIIEHKYCGNKCKFGFTSHQVLLSSLAEKALFVERL